MAYDTLILCRLVVCVWAFSADSFPVLELPLLCGELGLCCFLLRRFSVLLPLDKSSDRLLMLLLSLVRVP
jgi:hypothetical protein